MGFDLSNVANVVRLGLFFPHVKGDDVPGHVGKLAEPRNEYLEEEPSCSSGDEADAAKIHQMCCGAVLPYPSRTRRGPIYST